MTAPGFKNGRLRSSDNLPSLQENYFWVGNENGEPEAIPVDSPIIPMQFGYYYCANPVYVNSNQYTVANFAVRNSDDDGDISKQTSTTLDMSTTGINGIAQSSDLAGTITTASGSQTITGTGTSFLTDFIVGDVFWTPNFVSYVIGITNDTELTIEFTVPLVLSDINYRRGGEIPSEHYFVYAISKDEEADPGLILSTRNVAGGDALVDLPSGYTKSRQLVFVLTNDASGNLIQAIWNGNSCHYYRFANQLTDGTATSYTDVNLSAYVPATSQLAYLNLSLRVGAVQTSRTASLRTNGESNQLTMIGCYVDDTNLNSVNANQVQIVTDEDQLIEYQLSGNNASLTISVVGYEVTKIAS